MNNGPQAQNNRKDEERVNEELNDGPSRGRETVDLQSVTRPPVVYNAETIEDIKRLVSDPDNPFFENIEIFASSPQGQKSHSLDGGTEKGGRYTKELIHEMDGVNSIEQAHQNASEAKSLFWQPPVESVNQNDTEWSPSTEVVEGRRVLLISGTEESKNDGFTRDTEQMKSVLIDKYGVDPANIVVLDTPNKAEIESALKELSEEGSDQLLVYYTGHALLDRENISRDAKDGVVSASDVTKIQINPVINGYPDRPDNPQGNEHGTLMLQKAKDGSEAVFLHEHTLKDMLNPLAEEFPGGITIILDTCYSGSFIAGTERDEPDRNV